MVTLRHCVRRRRVGEKKKTSHKSKDVVSGRGKEGRVMKDVPCTEINPSDFLFLFFSLLTSPSTEGVIFLYFVFPASPPSNFVTETCVQFTSNKKWSSFCLFVLSFFVFQRSGLLFLSFSHLKCADVYVSFSSARACVVLFCVPTPPTLLLRFGACTCVHRIVE